MLYHTYIHWVRQGQTETPQQPASWLMAGVLSVISPYWWLMMTKLIGFIKRYHHSHTHQHGDKNTTPARCPCPWAPPQGRADTSDAPTDTKYHRPNRQAYQYRGESVETAHPIDWSFKRLVKNRWSRQWARQPSQTSTQDSNRPQDQESFARFLGLPISLTIKPVPNTKPTDSTD